MKAWVGGIGTTRRGATGSANCTPKCYVLKYTTLHGLWQGAADTGWKRRSTNQLLGGSEALQVRGRGLVDEHAVLDDDAEGEQKGRQIRVGGRDHRKQG